MVRGSLYIFFQRRHTNGQKALEKILNITHHREMQIKTKMRCHFTPVRMTIIKMTKKKKKKKYWQGCGGKGTFVHYWWKCKLV